MPTITCPNGQVIPYQFIAGPGYLNVQVSQRRGRASINAVTGEYIIQFDDDSIAVLTAKQFSNIFGSFILTA